MEALGKYVISVSIAALLCGMISSLCAKGSFKPIIRILCGVYILIAFLQPVHSFSFRIPDTITDLLSDEEKEAVSRGEQAGKDAFAQVIIQEAQSYILDKAQALGLSIQAEVFLDQGIYPVPKSVRITGTVPADAQQQLSTMLEQDLGIRKEDQVWNG